MRELLPLLREIPDDERLEEPLLREIPELRLELPDDRLMPELRLEPLLREVPELRLLREMPELRLVPLLRVVRELLPLLREIPDDERLDEPLLREMPELRPELPDDRLMPELRLDPPIRELLPELRALLPLPLLPRAARCASSTSTGVAKSVTVAIANKKNRTRLGVSINDLLSGPTRGNAKGPAGKHHCL